MDSRWIGMTIDSDHAMVPPLAAACRGVFAEFDAQSAIELEMCLVDAVNDVIEFAYGGQRGGRIRLYVALELGEVIIAIVDNGRTRTLPEGADADAERGVALGMLHLVMDAVSFESSRGVNRLIMRRAVRGHSGSCEAEPLRRAACE